MGNTNRVRSTLKIQPGGPPYIPEKDRDQYFPEDYIFDQDYLDGKRGDFWGNFLEQVPCILEGSGIVTRVSDTQIIISEFFGWVVDSKNIIRELYNASTGNITPSLVLGDGQYYCKINYSEVNYGSQRTKVYAAVNYYAYTQDGVVLTIDKTSPVIGEICLGGFIVSGGVITLANTNSRSANARFNFEDFPVPDGSIELHHLDPAVQTALSAEVIPLYRGTYAPLFSIDPANRRKGKFFLENRQLAEADGTDLTLVKQEQLYVVSRLDKSRLTGAFTKGVLTGLIESAIERTDFVPSTILNNAGHHYRMGMKCAIVGTGYNFLKVVLHNSINIELGSALIAIGSLVVDQWFYLDMDVAGLNPGETYHYHIYVNEGSYVNQPFLYCADATPKDLLFKEYYKPSAGIYKNPNVVNFLDEVGAYIVPLRAPGDDIVIGNIPPDERTTTGGYLDILPMDLSNDSIWDTYEFYDYILIDTITGRVKFPSGYDVRDYYVEFNAKIQLADVDAHSILRHQKTESIEMSLQNLEDGFIEKEIDEVSLISTPNVEEYGLVDGSEAFIWTISYGIQVISFSFVARKPGVDKFRDIFFKILYMMLTSEAGDIKFTANIYINGVITVSSPIVEIVNVANDSARHNFTFASIKIDAGDFLGGEEVRVEISRDNDLVDQHTGSMAIFKIMAV